MSSQLPQRADLLALFAAPLGLALCPPGDYLQQLHPQEQALAGAMGSRRLRGFTAGRVAAREALAQLGLRDCPVLIADQRKPRWPEGVCGSISHCPDQCIAVAASLRQVAGVGVDVEQLKRLDGEVEKLILTQAERAHIRSLPAGVNWACVLFSIKESLFKCLNPVSGNWIDFQQAELTLQPQQGSCHIELDPVIHSDATRDAPLSARYLCTASHVFSAATLLRRRIVV